MEQNRTKQQKYGKENGVPERTGMSLREYDFLANSASTMDCTGLMYRVPEDDMERLNYQQVYRYEPPEDEK
ncbi:MAG: hypothetical protein ACI4ES_00210 [Roseburia sp.]